jgi:glycosyltransferase involved in cell wall biosynthesis
VLREAPSAHTAEAFEQARIEQELTGVSLPPGHAFRFDAARLAQEEAEFAAVDCLLVPSSQAAETYEARGIPSHRIARHHYGYDPEAFTSATRGEQELQAIFVGRGEPTKGLHYALQAWTQSTLARRAKFLIVGDMLPDYKRYLEPLLSHPSVELRPFSTDVGALLARASLVVLSSVTEGSALVTYEAFGAGCVGLVSDATGAPCTDGIDGLVHPRRDPNALRAHLDLLDTDPQTLGRLRKGVATRRGELTWARAGDVLTARYREHSRPANDSATQV